jgi:(E)-4-hydroxy-3-methylbut-2-enyl-diphosphate synthase
MEYEVLAGREILAAVAEDAGVKRKGVVIVSCPRCGRNGFDTHGFTERWQSALYSLDKDITVAIMGCAVNGPEEARHADLGITGAGNKVLLFRHGQVIRTIDAKDADTAFREELENL